MNSAFKTLIMSLVTKLFVTSLFQDIFSLNFAQFCGQLLFIITSFDCNYQHTFLVSFFIHTNPLITKRVQHFIPLYSANAQSNINVMRKRKWSTSNKSVESFWFAQETITKYCNGSQMTLSYKMYFCIKQLLFKHLPPVSAKLKHSTGTVKHTIEIFHD